MQLIWMKLKIHPQSHVAGIVPADNKVVCSGKSTKRLDKLRGSLDLHSFVSGSAHYGAFSLCTLDYEDT